MFVIFLALFAALPLLCVQGQNSTTSSASAIPTSLGSLPTCVRNCTTIAATQAGCTGLTDLKCVCTSQKFQTTAGTCLKAQCSTSDQEVATELQSTLCASVSSTITNASSVASSTSNSGSISGSTSATNSVSTTTSASSAAYMGMDTNYVIAFVAVLASLIAGTLL